MRLGSLPVVEEGSGIKKDEQTLSRSHNIYAGMLGLEIYISFLHSVECCLPVLRKIRSAFG